MARQMNLLNHLEWRAPTRIAWMLGTIALGWGLFTLTYLDVPWAVSALASVSSIAVVGLGALLTVRSNIASMERRRAESGKDSSST